MSDPEDITIIIAVDIGTIPLGNEYGSGMFAGMRTRWSTLEEIGDRSTDQITDMVFIESAVVDNVIEDLTDIRDQLVDPIDEEKE